MTAEARLHCVCTLLVMGAQAVHDAELMLTGVSTDNLKREEYKSLSVALEVAEEQLRGVVSDIRRIAERKRKPDGGG